MSLNTRPNSNINYAPINISSIAYTNSLIVKSSAGILYNITGFNSKTSSQFIHLYDSATLPNESSIPVLIFCVGSLNNFSLDLGVYGRYFSNGIVICNSSTGPIKTIGSADCWFDCQFK